MDKQLHNSLTVSILGGGNSGELDFIFPQNCENGGEDRGVWMMNIFPYPVIKNPVINGH